MAEHVMRYREYYEWKDAVCAGKSDDAFLAKMNYVCKVQDEEAGVEPRALTSEEKLWKALVDPSMVAYLEALPGLIAGGHEGKYFTADAYARHTAIGETYTQSVENFYASQRTETWARVVRISAQDLTEYKEYYERKLRSPTTGPEPS
jgi:hypothetical protein